MDNPPALIDHQDQPPIDPNVQTTSEEQDQPPMGTNIHTMIDQQGQPPTDPNVYTTTISIYGHKYVWTIDTRKGMTSLLLQETLLYAVCKTASWLLGSAFPMPGRHYIFMTSAQDWITNRRIPPEPYPTWLALCWFTYYVFWAYVVSFFWDVLGESILWKIRGM